MALTVAFIVGPLPDGFPIRLLQIWPRVGQAVGKPDVAIVCLWCVCVSNVFTRGELCASATQFTIYAHGVCA